MQTPLIADPFALMLDPEAVFTAIARSEHLSGLRRRVCRPLDKPLLAGAARDNDDAEIDAEPEIAEEESTASVTL